MTGRTYATELHGRIASALDEGVGQPTAVLAGHFAVFTAGGRANDLLDHPRALGAHTDMLDFARASWTAACDVISWHGSARLLVLADDIQFVRPALPDRGARERLGAALAADYLRRTSTLPAFHHRELEARDLTTERVIRSRDDCWIFSERALRNAAVARIREVARAGVITRGAMALEANADASRIVVRDPELGEHTLVHSGNTSCAGGYLELAMQLHERGVRWLVAVVPRRCLGPVTLGAQLARSVFGATTLSVVNIPAGGDTGRQSDDLRDTA